jgi:hypothetical protein
MDGRFYKNWQERTVKFCRGTSSLFFLIDCSIIKGASQSVERAQEKRKDPTKRAPRNTKERRIVFVCFKEKKEEQTNTPGTPGSLRALLHYKLTLWTRESCPELVFAKQTNMHIPSFCQGLKRVHIQAKQIHVVFSYCFLHKYFN